MRQEAVRHVSVNVVALARLHLVLDRHQLQASEIANRVYSQEAEEEKVDLPEDETDIIKPLVEYLYEGECDPKLPDSKTIEEIDNIIRARVDFEGKRVEVYRTHSWQNVGTNCICCTRIISATSHLHEE
jgi:hypothetical protein